jgi:hypothetical protein
VTQTAPKGKKVRTKAKEDLAIEELVKLYEKKYNKQLNSLEALIVRAQIALHKEGDTAVAKARVRGGDRGGRFEDISFDTDEGRVQEASDRAWQRIAEQKEVADEARAKSKSFFRMAEQYQLVLRKLEGSFRHLATGGLGPVDDKASAIAADLHEADQQIALYKLALAGVEQAADQFDKTVQEIRDRGLLESVQEAKAVPAMTLESLKALDNAQKKLADTIEAVNAFGQTSAGKIEGLILDIASKIVAWRASKDFNQNVDTFESLANGTVTAVNALNAEPMSHSALQGIHALIHGACDGIKLLRNLYKRKKLQALGKGDINKVLNELKADDFIQWKCDMVQMSLRWATEPLGFVPHAGEVIRSAVDAAVKSCIDIIRKAAEDQAKRFEAAKKLPPGSPPPPKEDFSALIADFESNLLQAAKAEAQKLAEAAAETIWEEAKDKLAELGGHVANVLKDGADAVPNLIVGSIIKILSSAVKPLLARLMPEMKMIDKKVLMDSVASARTEASDMNARAGAMKNLRQETRYTLDEDKLISMGKAAALGLGEGDSAPWVLIQGDVLQKTGGFALMIGADHDEANKRYVEQMVDSGFGWSGTVTAGQTKSGLFKQNLYFDCLDLPKDKQAEVKKFFTKYMTLDSKRSFNPGPRPPK